MSAPNAGPNAQDDLKKSKNQPVREKQGEGGKKQMRSINSDEAKKRLRKAFLQNVAASVMATRDKMDAKTAWRLDMNETLHIAPQTNQSKISSAESLSSQAAKQRRAERFALKPSQKKP